MSTYIPKYAPQNAVAPKPKPRVSLAALQWAADRAGQSYGRFTQRLKPVDETRIQEEFEQYRRDHLAELAQRHGRPLEAADAANDEYIITDEDV